MKISKLNKSFNKIIYFLIILIVGILVKNNFNFSFAYNGEDNKINNSNIDIYFFDVGQADSILIKNDDDAMLIDAGNNNDGNNLVNYLKNVIGLSDIDIVVGTHPHEDHIGGLDDVIDNFDIDKIYLPDVITTSKTFEDLLDIIEKKNLSINIPKIDEEFKLGNINFKVLYTGTDEKELNNSSIVLKMNYGNTTYLFTGDATSKIEKLILDKNIDVDVLKVAHHGSNYSSTEAFLDRVSPMYAIIQVGENNNYGHPSKEVLNRFIEKNITVYRTDIDGTIKLSSDGNDIEFQFLNTNIDG